MKNILIRGLYVLISLMFPIMFIITCLYCGIILPLILIIAPVFMLIYILTGKNLFSNKIVLFNEYYELLDLSVMPFILYLKLIEKFEIKYRL